ncbi:MAG: HAD-IC family P-type ATPase [Deltaproteobacteria bacterium]|nr:HAD-IC family P-type ATPase [Deltaproteobacteria bacterium]
MIFDKNRTSRPFLSRDNVGVSVIWHAVEAHQAVEKLDGRQEGLSEPEADERIERFGPNIIALGRPEGPLTLFLRQLNSPLLYVLLGSGAIALFLGKVTDGAVVLGVVALNAVIGFIQEYRAQKEITALGQMVPDTANVRRDSRVTRVPVADVVPGDIVLLQSGDRVPADLRLLAVKNLQIDESALTGESVPVIKQAGVVSEDSAIGDRTCMSYGGTMVTSGTGVGIAVATGGGTELGRISELLGKTEVMTTPLTRSMASVSLWLTFVILGVTALLFGVGWLRGYSIADATVAAISLAVAAIPEGLPAIITIALAIGVRRMAIRRVIIRSLPAVETLGSTTVICSDKTGTLTKNEMTVQSIWTSSGEFQLSGVGYDPEGLLLKNGKPIASVPPELVDVARAGMLCNDSALVQSPKGRWVAEGDPTEVALIVAGRKLGLHEKDLGLEWPRIDSVPFESERQLMGTLHRSPQGQHVIFIKGAPEVVLQRCESLSNGEPLNKTELRKEIENLAATGLRVLAMASRVLDKPFERLDAHHLNDGFFLLGMQGMSDPPRPEAIASIEQCSTAGIKVKMITGDHAATALAVGRQLGLLHNGVVVSGTELVKISDEELGRTVASAGVFARVAPEHKLRLVSALQKNGEIVAMTGDGVNDAPALKRADIGVAMGITGTAVSRQASDMVLTDDNFASIVSAVEEGRRVFDNLVKSLVFVLPTNIGEALVILVAVMFFPIIEGHPVMPILPVQILWVNLVATVALALPLAFEAMERNVMARPPRNPKAPLLDAFVVARTVYIALLMTAGAIAFFHFELRMGLEQGLEQARATREAQTAAVTTIIVFQAFYLITCRSLNRSVFSLGLFTNPKVFIGIGSILLLQLGFVYLPFMNSLFGSAPLRLEAWLRTIAMGAVVWPAVALEKLIRTRLRAHHTARSSKMA